MEFVSFDLETTGTLSHLDHIVEIGAVRFVAGKVRETYQQLISIDESMPEQATAINGITDDMLKGQPSIQKALLDFSKFCSDSLMVAHNAPFDFQFLLRAVEEYRSPAPRGWVLDTCQLSRVSLPGLPNYKLSTLCRYLKIPSNNFHRAEADALYCGYLFVHILKEKKNPLLTANQVKDIIELSGRKPLKFPQYSSEVQLDLC